VASKAPIRALARRGLVERTRLRLGTLHNRVTLPYRLGLPPLRRAVLEVGSLELTAHATPGNGFPALVLNADFRPLSYYPLSLWSWQDAIKAVFLDRVNIVEEYDHAVRSPSIEMRLPSVVSLKTFVRPSTHPAFTRFNVFLRDRFSCQYCGSREDLTFDHLLPRSRGGHTTWVNVVAACSACNLRKGNMTPAEAKMWPAQMPFQPTVQHLHRNGRLFPPNYLHESWLDYLYWDTELDP
jgi:5-methylcytosine-specific restriction endonuclease McrA